MDVMLWAHGTVEGNEGKARQMTGFVQFTTKGYFTTSPYTGCILEAKTATKHLDELRQSHPRLTVIVKHVL